MRYPKHNPAWILTTLLVVALVAAGCGKKTQQPDFTASAEPDKILFERAMADIQERKYDVARLTLQTLLNAYPDSEYLAQAKLAIADAYYAEGGTSALTQAVAEYKDFITFFPFLEEAAYAQMRVGMIYYRRMEKPDRDRTNARLAEEELQAFLLKYPNHELSKEATQRLREVQEVLAEGDYRIANYYYVKGSPRAAAGRLLELVDRYPLFSRADRALWMLGDTYDRNERGEVAAQYYSRILSDYPLSEHVDKAKERLIALGFPVPQPKPEALERMQRENEMAREGGNMLRKFTGMLKTGPDVSMSARTGDPNMSPPSEPTSGVQILTPGGTSTVGANGGSSAGVAVQTVTPMPQNTAASTSPVAVPTGAAKAKKDEEEKDPDRAAKKKKAEEEKKKKEESSSKKKKGIRRIIPW